MDSPRVYLSVASTANGERRWCCIVGGCPITPEVGMVPAVMAYHRAKRRGEPDADASMVWDGDIGAFVPMKNFPVL